MFGVHLHVWPMIYRCRYAKLCAASEITVRIALVNERIESWLISDLIRQPLKRMLAPNPAAVRVARERPAQRAAGSAPRGGVQTAVCADGAYRYPLAPPYPPCAAPRR